MGPHCLRRTAYLLLSMRSCCTTDGTVATGSHSSVSRSLKDQPEDRDCTSLVILENTVDNLRGAAFAPPQLYTHSTRPSVLIDKTGERPVHHEISLLGKGRSPWRKGTSTEHDLYYCKTRIANTVKLWEFANVKYSQTWLLVSRAGRDSTEDGVLLVPYSVLRSLHQCVCWME